MWSFLYSSSAKWVKEMLGCHSLNERNVILVTDSLRLLRVWRESRGCNSLRSKKCMLEIEPQGPVVHSICRSLSGMRWPKNLFLHSVWSVDWQLPRCSQTYTLCLTLRVFPSLSFPVFQTSRSAVQTRARGSDRGATLYSFGPGPQLWLSFWDDSLCNQLVHSSLSSRRRRLSIL